MAGNPALCKESPADILDFWLAAGPDRWFEKDDEFGAQIRATISEHLRGDSGVAEHLGWSGQKKHSL